MINSRNLIYTNILDLTQFTSLIILNQSLYLTCTLFILGPGYQNEKRKVIPLYQIISVHTESKKVLCETKNGTYYIQKRIYEMKEILPQKLFIQLSNSEIVNVTQIKAFSLSSTGSYQVDLSNGRRTYTSRRYAQIIRKELLK